MDKYKLSLPAKQVEQALLKAINNDHYKPIILTDRGNAQNYIVYVEDGELMSRPIKSGSGETVILRDITNGNIYSVYVECGELYIEAATDGVSHDNIKITDRLTWLNYSIFVDNGEMQICGV